MHFLRLVLLCISLFSSVNALATVVYQWETLSTSPTIHSAQGRIEITETAWLAGSAGQLSYVSPQATYYRPPGCQFPYYDCDIVSYADPFSPIASFFFTINESSAAINLDLIGGHGLLHPIEEGGFFRATFTIVGNEMDLNVYANTAEHTMQASGNEITYFVTDSPYFGRDCAIAPGCGGATGRWVQVPEPPILSILGIGLVMLGRLQKRRSRKVMRPDQFDIS